MIFKLISKILLQNWHQVNATEYLWWGVNIGSGIHLVPSGNKPVLVLMLNQIYYCHHMASKWVISWETSEQQPIDFLYFWQVHLLSDKAPCNVEELCEINTYIFMCNYDPWMRFSLLVKWFQKGMSPGGHSRGYYPDTLSSLSSHCDSSEDQLHVDEICGYPIFTFTKAAVIWLNDRVLR